MEERQVSEMSYAHIEKLLLDATRDTREVGKWQRLAEQEKLWTCYTGESARWRYVVAFCTDAPLATGALTNKETMTVIKMPDSLAYAIGLLAEAKQ